MKKPKSEQIVRIYGPLGTEGGPNWDRQLQEVKKKKKKKPSVQASYLHEGMGRKQNLKTRLSKIPGGLWMNRGEKGEEEFLPLKSRARKEEQNAREGMKWKGRRKAKKEISFDEAPSQSSRRKRSRQANARAPTTGRRGHYAKKDKSAEGGRGTCSPIMGGKGESTGKPGGAQKKTARKGGSTYP